MRDVTHVSMWHDSFRRRHPHRHIHCSLEGDMTHSYVAHDSFIRGTWLIYICGTCFICMQDVTHLSMWHDFSHKQYPHRHVHYSLEGDMTPSYVAHDSFIRGTWLIYMRNMLLVWGTWLMYLCDMTSLIGGTPIDTYIVPSSGTVTLRVGVSTATHCNTLQHTAFCCTHCSTLQHAAAHCSTRKHTKTQYSTLQHAATRCSTLQHTAAYGSTLQWEQRTAAYYSTLQHPATHCSIL